MITVFREDPNSILPTKNNSSDAGFDLYASMTKTIKPKQRCVIEIGLRIIAPHGFYYTFAPRSSMAFKHNIIPSHHNVMDAGYTGPCGVLMLNRSDQEYTINQGDRFCQLLIHRVPQFEIKEISSQEFYSFSTDRGSNGLGSSGK